MIKSAYILFLSFSFCSLNIKGTHKDSGQDASPDEENRSEMIVDLDLDQDLDPDMDNPIDAEMNPDMELLPDKEDLADDTVEAVNEEAKDAWWVKTVSSGWATTSYGASTGQWYYVAGTYNGSEVRLHVNGNVESTTSVSGPIDYDSMPWAFYIAYYNDSDEHFRMNGAIDEVRLSDMVRNSAWIRATYESERDDLIDFSVEEFH